MVKFSPIRISTIIPEKKLPFEIYLYFKNQYIKYISIAQKITDDHLLKLKKQKIATFFIRDCDEMTYQNFLDEVIESSFSDKSVSNDHKINFTSGLASNALIDIQNQPKSENTFKTTERAASATQKLTMIGGILRNFYKRSIKEEGEIWNKHSLNVAALVSTMANNECHSEDEKSQLIIAGLAHDVGITQLPDQFKKLFTKAPHLFTLEEEENYYEHHKLGSKLLNQIPGFNQQISNLVHDHKEKILKRFAINNRTKLSNQEEIISLCNAYDKRVTVFSLSSAEALKAVQIKVDHLVPYYNYNETLLNRFKICLKEGGILN